MDCPHYNLKLVSEPPASREMFLCQQCGCYLLEGEVVWRPLPEAPPFTQEQLEEIKSKARFNACFELMLAVQVCGVDAAKTVLDFYDAAYRAGYERGSWER